MRRTLGLLILGFFLTGWGSQTVAKVVGLYLYHNRVFLEEVFSVTSGKNRLSLVGAPKADEIFCMPSRALEVVSLEVRQEEGHSPLLQRLKALEKREKELQLEKKALEEKLDLLKAALESPSEAPSPETYQKYMAFLDRYLKQKALLEDKLEDLAREKDALEKSLAGKKVSVLEVSIQGHGEGKLLVRYPADGLVSSEEVYRISLDTTRALVQVKGQAVLKQLSGRDWQGVTLHFYPRGRRWQVVSPPPFHPWYLGLIPPPKKAITRAMPFLMEEFKAAPKPQRKTAPTGVWERIEVPQVSLPAGKDVVVNLGVETFPAKVALKVPVYAEARAYFQAEITPAVSLPPLKARIYRDGLFLGIQSLGAFVPGQKKVLYFGRAPLLEVKREVLKDTAGKPFLRRGREITEKIFRTVLCNRYRRPFQVVVVDRIPVSKRKEITVKAEATPRWTELSPEGKAIWRFTMKPQEKRKILLRLEINRPVQK